MLLWRISNYAELDGYGGQLQSGRWHTAIEGRRIVYLSEHPAVALVENLVTLSSATRFLPTHFQLLKVTAAHGAEVQELTPSQLASVDPKDEATTQSLGDAWLAARKSPLLRVPSIPSPESWNYLFNPLHPRAAAVKVDWARRITYDKRLFHLAHA